MKKTQIKDALGNIWANKVSYLSIIVIAMLAALTYLAITFTAEAISRKASSYFEEYGMWDLEVTSTMLMDGEDLEAVRALPGVASAEASYQMPAVLRIGKRRESVTLVALTESTSLPERLRGRVPKRRYECMVEEVLADSLGIKVGDRFNIKNASVAGIDPVRQKDYLVTGTFRAPEHITYRISVTPYVLVTQDSFDLKTLDGAFMMSLIRVKDAPVDRYSADYLTKVGAVRQEIEKLAETRAPIRSEQLRAQLQAKIDEGQQQLDEAQRQLDEGQAKLDRSAQQLLEARAKIDAGQRDLEAAAEELGIGKDKLDTGELELRDAKEELKEAAEKLRAAREKLKIVDYYVAKGKDWILSHVTEETWPPDIGMTYAEFVTMLNQDAGKVLAWAYAKTGYTANLEKFKHAEALFEANRLLWYDSGEQYLDGVTRFEQGKKQLEEGEKQLEAGQKEFEEGQRQLIEGQEKLEAGKRQLQQAKDQLALLGNCRWITLTNEGNGGYVFARANAENFNSLSMTFSLLFVVVAALVIYSTVARLVQEQSKLVGATKAMGLYNREIFGKYLIFGVSSTLIGVALGILLARFFLEPMLLKVYADYFSYGRSDPVFLPLPTALVVLGAILLSVASVWLACSKLLRSTAISLMQGTSLVSKLTSAKRSAKGSLYTRMIVLNMRTDLKRVAVTTVSIAGCCSLLMIGFTIKYAVGRVSARQFGELVTYDLRLSYASTDDDPDGSELEEELHRRGYQYIRAFCGQRSFIVGEQLNTATLVVAPADEIGDYFVLRDASARTPLTLPASGVFIPERMHEFYKLDAGGSFYLNDDQMVPHASRAAAVIENYYPLNLYCSPEAYEELAGEKLTENCFLIRLNGADASTLEDAVDELASFVSLDDARAEQAHFEQLTTVMDLLVIVMILLAGMLGFFILLNLSNTFIQQKNRELTIMRINGFTTGECIRYVAIDMAITTALGVAVGLVAGYFLGDLIAKLMEQPNVVYVHAPDLRAFVFSTLITLLLSAFINSFALRKIKKLKLSDLA